MVKNLVIVESPAKAKTIEGFLGKDFLVKSSFGHVRDLSKKNISVDIENGFMPNYEISLDKKKLVTELKKLSAEAKVVWLATDEDREGEAISWHLMDALNIEESKVKRIVFHEITKKAISQAIENPRSIDKNLVDAQQARRVLDRLVGFEISPILWKKVKPSLSAGRVQSVAVRLIVEREKEIDGFNSTSAFKIVGEFEVINKNGKGIFKAELPNRFVSESDAHKFLEQCVGSTFSVGPIETKPAKKSPSPPFTTSTLQQEASRKLGFSVSKTMMVAQQLYESGKITYMRTDSVNLSDDALAMAKEEITSVFGNEYVKTRQYTTKSKGAQEAHEAIRPTYMNNHAVTGDDSQKRLYDLIWKRTIASQMSDAIIEKTNVLVDVSKASEKFVAKGEVIKFEGFLKVYLESTDDEDDEQNKSILPPMTKGDPLNMRYINAIERFSLHPPRYTEASLVKKLEELGIGRPSTYAPIISTIQKREYVTIEDREGRVRTYTLLSIKNNKIEKEICTENTGAEKNKLFPTDIGIVVTGFLMSNFKNILDYNFTASVEKEFDEIAQGNKVWNKMIKDFYKPFHLQVEETLANSEKAKGERLLGIEAATGKNIYVRIGKFGPMVQIGDMDPNDKPRFARLKKGQSIETISMDEAMDLFKLPRVIGTFEEKDITVGIGKFGPYLRHNNLFYSLPKTEEPLSIMLDRSIEIILEKRDKDAKKVIKEFAKNPEIKVLNGRWGAYISYNKANYKIPKDQNPEKLSLEDCLAIIDATPEKKGKAAVVKSTVTKEKSETSKKTKKEPSKSSTKAKKDTKKTTKAK